MRKDLNPGTEIKRSDSYKWLVLINVMITTFMAVLDSTVVNTGLPVIMGTLGASMNTAEWILTGYMLSMATVLSAAGWLSNRFGYRNIFLISLSIFTFGSFMCGNSDSIGELIFWRIIEGVGGGLLMPVGMAIVTTVFPPQERGMALGFWAIATAASVSFGPMIGGYLVDNFNWNYIFYINIPIGIFCIIYTLIIQKGYELQSKLKFDFWGFLFSAIFLPVFLYGLSQVNSSTNPEGWSSTSVMACMWISAVCFILFIFTEFTVKVPLINLRIFKDKNFSLANIVIFIFGIGMFGSTFLIPLYMQDTLGYSAFEAGLLFLPVGILQAIASPLSGKLSKVIDARIIIILGLVMLAYSFILNFSFSFQTDRDYILHSLIIRGVGLGILYPPLLTVSLANMGSLEMAQASSISNIVRQVGGSVGVAIFTYMLAIRRNFHSQRYAEALDYTGEQYQQTIQRLSDFYLSTGSDTQQSALSSAKQYIVQHLNTEAYISGINDDFIIGAVITLLAIIPVLFFSFKTSR
ncbi:MAG: DHA2 family efflux MFS transporter permease subunit [Bacteroidales bacterium]